MTSAGRVDFFKTIFCIGTCSTEPSPPPPMLFLTPLTYLARQLAFLVWQFWLLLILMGFRLSIPTSLKFPEPLPNGTQDSLAHHYCRAAVVNWQSEGDLKNSTWCLKGLHTIFIVCNATENGYSLDRGNGKWLYCRSVWRLKSCCRRKTG